MSVTINGTTGIAGVAGSASTPAFQGTDTDSGYYINSANEPNASINGTAAWSAASTFGFKNRFINPNFEIWQRGTTGTGAVYVADRWSTDQTNTTQARSTDVPSGIGALYSLQVSASSGTSATSQKVESINCRDLVSQQVTVSFYAKASSGTPTLNFDVRYANSLNNFATTTIMQSTSITLSTTWTKYSFAFNALNANVANGLQVFFYITSGATFLLSQAQLEKGATATSFDYRSITTELALCQRYYFKTFAQGTTPAQNVSANNLMLASSTTGFITGVVQPVAMRTAGAVVTYNPYAANSSFRVPSSSTDVPITGYGAADWGISVFNTSLAAPFCCHAHYTNDAEL